MNFIVALWLVVSGFYFPLQPAFKDTIKDSTNRIFQDTLKTYIFPEVISKAVPEYDNTGKLIVTRDVMINTPSFIVPDPLRSLALLPYVNVDDEVFPASMYVKGGRPEENSYFIEGFPVLFPFHFAFTTAVPINIISKYDFYTLDIPPEYSGTVSAAINFHLRDENFRELFIDPTSSLHYASCMDGKSLISFRLTSFSLPLYFMKKGKYFYGFGDFIYENKLDRGFKNLVYFSYDRYKDAETDMIEGEYANFTMGLLDSHKNVRMYFSGGLANSKDLATLNSIFTYKKGILGLIYKNQSILPIVLHVRGINISLQTEEDSVLENLVYNGHYVNAKGFIPVKVSSSISLTPGINVYYLNRTFKASPELDFSGILLDIKKSSFFRIGAGISGQLSISADYESGLSFVVKNGNIKHSVYIQSEYRSNNKVMGIFYRYYPDYFLFSQRVHVINEVDSVINDTLYNIELIDTLVNAKKNVYGLYLSTQGGLGKYSYYGDLSYTYGNIIESTGIRYPLPFTSEISCRLLISRRLGKFVLTISSRFKSNTYDIRFYRQNASGRIYEISSPDIINLGPYFRVDVGINAPLRIFHRVSMLAFGVYNLVWKKPKESGFISDRYIRTPVPYMGLRIKL